TDKAAREMRARIRGEIEKWLHASQQAEPGAAGNAFWQTIFSELDAARIGTIHSLCAEILRTHPAEARVDPGFDVLEEGWAAAFKTQAIETALAWAADDTQAAALFGIFKEGALRQVLDNLIQRRLELTSEDASSSPLHTWSQAVADWCSARLASSAWCDSLADLAGLRSHHEEDKLELARQDVLTAWKEIEPASEKQAWEIVFTQLAELRKAISTGGQKGNWAPDDLEAAREAMRSLREFYDTELKTLVGGHPPKVNWALDVQLAQAWPALHRLIDRLLKEYQRLKDEIRALDFDDLEGKAAQLLSENAVVRARWQRETRAVLVDEFQDTNERQRRIVYAIAGFDPARSRQVDSPVDGSSLFIVGDAKQSIYKFRNADVTVFRQVQADIAAVGGLAIDLDLTFRTHQPLLDTLNGLLAPVLGERHDPARPYEVPFAALQAYRTAPRRASVNPPYVELILGLGDDAPSGRLAAALALAERLQHFQAHEGFEWGDMALLFRASTAFEVYENALAASGIPFVTIAGRGFYERPEIRDLLNALTAIADPSDDLALAGLLRSPAIGCSDADLYRLRYTDGDEAPTPFWRALENTDAFQADHGRRERAVNIITELNALVGRAPAAQVLKRYLDLTGYRTMLGLVPGGGRLQRNVDKLLADAHRSRMVSLDDFLTYVQTLRDVGTREGEAPVEAAGAVQLMTVHKAKGLEFPLVVIADAAYQPPSRSDTVLLDEQLGLLVGLRDAGGARPVTYKLADLAESERDDAEDKRLLYVAATRAQEKLLINGHVKRLKAGGLSLGGWLARLGEIVGLTEISLAGEFDTPQVLELNSTWSTSDLACSLNPLRPAPPTPDLPAPAPAVQEPYHPTPDQGALPDLAAPVRIPEERLLDEKILARQADPPQRVWRVVPRAKRPSGPAWVVGKLVHEAIRHWRFPADGFAAFIMPFALEAGLTDRAETNATIDTAARLLARFKRHPLWAEIEAAERYHEVPYALPGDRGIIDLLYRTPAGWVIVDFKTDEVRSELEMWATIRANGYDQQVNRYRQAVLAQLGQSPRALLVFLQVSGAIGLADIEPARG
ncbi:MAG: UvrD-helicase domain-containing protein, partial [Anaerolineales bacterium]|nr:UvrD-helicase domain-containing protein [Anaerolineales bacterium]